MILANGGLLATAPRLQALHRAEDIGSALKRGVNVCQRQLVNEVLGLLLRSSFAILVARTRHLFNSVPMPAFSAASRSSNSSDIVRSPVRSPTSRAALHTTSSIPSRSLSGRMSV